MVKKAYTRPPALGCGTRTGPRVGSQVFDYGGFEFGLGVFGFRVCVCVGLDLLGLIGFGSSASET